MCSQKNGGVPNKVTPPEMELRVTAKSVKGREGGREKKRKKKKRKQRLERRKKKRRK